LDGGVCALFDGAGDGCLGRTYLMAGVAYSGIAIDGGLELSTDVGEVAPCHLQRLRGADPVVFGCG
jgi:hypothetical protein